MDLFWVTSHYALVSQLSDGWGCSEEYIGAECKFKVNAGPLKCHLLLEVNSLFLPLSSKVFIVQSVEQCSSLPRLRLASLDTNAGTEKFIAGGQPGNTPAGK